MKHEISVNATNLLANVFSLKNESLSTPYVLNYKYNVSDKLAFRSGLGFAYNNDDNGSVQSVQAESRSIDLRIGVEKSIHLSSGFYVGFGLDLLGGGKSVESNANGFSLRTAHYKWGVGPVLRFSYKFKNRISLMTEVPLYFVNTTGTRAEFDPALGANEVRFKESEFSIQEPRVLFIGISF